jgi:hypothetical protein
MSMTPAASVAASQCKMSSYTLAGVAVGDKVVLSVPVAAALTSPLIAVNTTQDTAGTLKVRWCNGDKVASSGAPPAISMDYTIIR